MYSARLEVNLSNSAVILLSACLYFGTKGHGTVARSAVSAPRVWLVFPISEHDYLQ